MNYEQLAARCVFPRIDIDRYYSDVQYRDNINTLAEKGAGGFCLFRGTITNTKKLTANLQSIASQKLLFSADMEHGIPMRIAGGTEFPHHMALGKTRDEQKIKRVAGLIAREGKSIGFQWNLAPVCDINSNKQNPIINIRSFADNHNDVSVFSSYFIEATQAEGVIACAKHFPGHGDTDIDSHIFLPVLKFDRKRLDDIEFIPFINAIKSGVKSVMIGHLSVPALDDSGIPASLSEKIVTGILRNELDFNGIILSDALEMNSISDFYTSGVASVRALRAGNNIALMPVDPFEAIEAISSEMKASTEFSGHIEYSAQLIDDAVKWADSFEGNDLSMNEQNEYVALDVALSAVELEDKKMMIPINGKKQYASFAIIQKEDDMERASFFFRVLGQALEGECDFGYIDKNLKTEDLARLKGGIVDAEYIIYAFFNKSRAWGGEIGISEEFRNKIDDLAEGKDKICIFFGNPYIRDEMECDVSICTFSDSPASVAASVVVLSGRTPGN